MKKILALTLALLLMLSAACALAESAQSDAGQLLSAEATDNTVTITKEYTVNGTNAVNPADTLKFTVSDGVVTEATAGTEAPAISVADVQVTQGATSAEVVVALPAYEKVGVYTYTITEQDTHTAGVTYFSHPITLVVTVMGQTDASGNYSLKALPAIHCETAAGEAKTDRFTNTYDAGSLAVKKTVAGNLGDRTKVFNFTVTFTAPQGDTVGAPITWSDDGASHSIAPADWNQGTATASFTLIHDETVTFDNIPAGTTYTVVEAEADQDDYTTTKTGDTGTIASATTAQADFTNTRERSIETGVTLDTLPYTLLLAISAIGAALLLRRRRDEA